MSATPQTTTPVDETEVVAIEPDTAEKGARGWLRRLAEGELSSLRVVLVLALIWVYFAIANDHFLTPENLTNLALQIAAVGTVSVGVVLVLLLGEIDLSVGTLSGLCPSIMAVLVASHGWNPYLGILAGLVAGAAIGVFQGTIIAWLVIPSFVVTLAGFLMWQGVQLAVLGSAGTVNVTDPAITNLANSFLAIWLGWVLAIVAIAWLIGGMFLRRRRRSAAQLELVPLASEIVRPLAASIVILVAAAVLNGDRGVPVSLCILIALVVGFDALVTDARFGRHVLAVGGNQEAARRTGIGIERVKVTIFALSGTLAAAGGILVVARLSAVNTATGGGDFLLLAIAGPVIAGVSLYGGRGSVWGALLGALIIGSISNGMDLLGYQASTKSIITGAVLLVAVILDALGRRQRHAHGKA
jgi:D-xylose transport system permease protein